MEYPFARYQAMISPALEGSLGLSAKPEIGSFSRVQGLATWSNHT
jgi:hypothetical protein